MASHAPLRGEFPVTSLQVAVSESENRDQFMLRCRRRGEESWRLTACGLPNPGRGDESGSRAGGLSWLTRKSARTS